MIDIPLPVNHDDARHALDDFLPSFEERESRQKEDHSDYFQLLPLPRPNEIEYPCVFAVGSALRHLLYLDPLSLTIRSKFETPFRLGRRCSLVKVQKLTESRIVVAETGRVPCLASIIDLADLLRNEKSFGSFVRLFENDLPPSKSSRWSKHWGWVLGMETIPGGSDDGAGAGGDSLESSFPRIVLGGPKSFLAMWNGISGEKIFEFPRAPRIVYSVHCPASHASRHGRRFDCDRLYVGSSGGNNILAYDLTIGRVSDELMASRHGSHQINEMTSMMERNCLITASAGRGKNKLSVFSLRTGLVVSRMSSWDQIHCIHSVPDLNQIVVAHQRNKISICDIRRLPDGESQWTRQRHLLQEYEVPIGAVTKIERSTQESLLCCSSHGLARIGLRNGTVLARCRKMTMDTDGSAGDLDECPIIPTVINERTLRLLRRQKRGCIEMHGVCTLGSPFDHPRIDLGGIEADLEERFGFGVELLTKTFVVCVVRVEGLVDLCVSRALVGD